MTVLLYDNPASGNCYKVRLILSLLGIEFERRELSVVDHSGRAEALGGQMARKSRDSARDGSDHRLSSGRVQRAVGQVVDVAADRT